MEKTNISKIIESLSGLKHHEWKSIESAVNRNFEEESKCIKNVNIANIMNAVIAL